MKYSAFRNISPWSQLIYTVFIMFGCTLIFLVIGVVFALPFVDISVLMSPDLMNETSPQAIVILKYLQIVQSLGLFIIPPFIAAYLFSTNVKGYLGINMKPKWETILLAFGLILVANPIINYLGEINGNMTLPENLKGLETWMRSKEDVAKEITLKLLNVETVGGLLFNIFLIGILPGLGEELVFRGIIQKLFHRITKNHHWAIWITAFLFSAMHFQFYGFIPRLILGAMFGYLYVWTGSLWVAIAAHFFNNTFATVITWMAHKEYINIDIESFGANSMLLVIASLLLTTLIIVRIRMVELSEQSDAHDQN